MRISDLPPGSSVTVPAAWLAERLAEEAEPEVLTTEQASEMWPAYSAETWRGWAADGLIGGAWQDAEGGPWRLPLASCRSVVADKQRRGQRRGEKGPRGPWAGRKAS
ncbi:MAG: hypothetical protein GWN53_17095 [Gammaproteobacteria bacterium]|uniref:Uncharacterized protein n=1 Tax=Candidatus Kutchimonas denitrificans TaxID=3056748 RepID=A0AAE4ZC45_9BACT|nr:hypothetical protein [Candidatus Kutchimonas denitrificans]NIV53558.1 hypothetical protein [Gammaproteobacteria bacterium]